MTALVPLLVQAQRAGLVLERSAGGTLTVRGARRHEFLVRAILARKTEALTLVDVYNGRVSGLDWRHATVADRPGPCVLCKRWAFIRDPFDNLPTHKTCAENRIRPGRQQEAAS